MYKNIISILHKPLNNKHITDQEVIISIKNKNKD